MHSYHLNIPLALKGILAENFMDTLNERRRLFVSKFDTVELLVL